MKNQLLNVSPLKEDNNSHKSSALQGQVSFQQSSTMLPEYWSIGKTAVALKRVSPLLVFTFVLPFFFIHIFDKGSQHNPILQIGLLLFLQINSVFVDFALWNYFEGKKIFRIWLIEAIFIVPTVYFLM